MAHWSRFCLRKPSGNIHKNILYQLVIELGPCKFHQNSFFTGRAWENLAENSNSCISNSCIYTAVDLSKKSYVFLSCPPQISPLMGSISRRLLDFTTLFDLWITLPVCFDDLYYICYKIKCLRLKLFIARPCLKVTLAQQLSLQNQFRSRSKILSKYCAYDIFQL